MGVVFSAAAELVGKDKLSRPWKKALRSAERQAGRSFSRMERIGLRATRVLNKGFRATGRGVRAVGIATRGAGRAMGAMARVTGGVVAAGALAVDQFGKYELAVARLGNILGTKGKDVVEEYGDELKKLSVELGVSPLETALAAYQALSGGVDRNKDSLIKFLRAAGQASVAGGTDMATAVKAATGVMEVFGDEVGDVNDIFNKLFVTEREGVTTFGELASNMGDVTSFARAMGLSFDEVLGPIASLTKTGLSTSAAFTQLTAIIAGVTNAQGKQKKAFRKFKIPFGPDAIKKAGGFVKLLEKIGAASRKDKGAFQKLFGRKEAIKGTARLAQSGLETLQETMAGFSGQTDIFQNNFKNMQKRTGFRIRQLKSGFSGLIGELGAGLAEGAGLAAIGSDKMGERFAKAGKAVKSGAKNFAQGFIGALTPGQKLADIDWDQAAKDAGVGFGKFIVILGKVGSVALAVVEAIADVARTVADLAGGDDPAQRAQQKTEARGDIVDPIEEAIEREEIREEFKRGRIGLGALAFSESPALRRLKAIQEAKGAVGTEKFGAAAKTAFGKATGLSQFTGTVSEAGEIFARGERRTSLAKSGRVLGELKPAGQQFKEKLEGVIKIIIEDKKSSGTASVNATTKNKNVKLQPAKTGKRKVAN